MDVDEFLTTKVLPEFREIVTTLHQLMHEIAPETTETISYGIPAFRLKRIIAVISPTKQGITFAFTRGAEFEDRYGLLRGKGTVSTHVKIKSVETADTEALRYYIRQAVALDSL